MEATGAVRVGMGNLWRPCPAGVQSPASAQGSLGSLGGSLSATARMPFGLPPQAPSMSWETGVSPRFSAFPHVRERSASPTPQVVAWAAPLQWVQPIPLVQPSRMLSEPVSSPRAPLLRPQVRYSPATSSQASRSHEPRQQAAKRLAGALKLLALRQTACGFARWRSAQELTLQRGAALLARLDCYDRLVHRRGRVGNILSTALAAEARKAARDSRCLALLLGLRHLQGMALRRRDKDLSFAFQRLRTAPPLARARLASVASVRSEWYDAGVLEDSEASSQRSTLQAQPMFGSAATPTGGGACMVESFTVTPTPSFPGRATIGEEVLKPEELTVSWSELALNNGLVSTQAPSQRSSSSMPTALGR
ncbi:unnamed protein product [Effrenium voratum]|uniref:Uncharacterized protein n=1 Tax=Effrenium voratum TaxID=2562239 RepID=A0AA36J502_9DINO|nr:unnamed protein product [Effrenium voratum]